MPWYYPSEDTGESGGGRRRSLLLPDTHAHLDAQILVDDLEQVIDRAAAAGVDRILAVGSDLASSEAAVRIAHKFDTVYAAVGIHPHESANFALEAEGVRSLLGEAKVVAVGEVGLDYFRGRANRETQLEAFREQITWAQDAGVAVSVHNRSADEDVLRMLKTLGSRAILHCFSSNWQVAEEAMRHGHHLSFAGNVTFPGADDLREVARQIPDNCLLIETDSPVLAPQPWRGKVNEPAYVVAVAETLARVRHTTMTALASLVRANADRVFRWRGE
jgi:TatD DNase family protein